MKFYSYLLSAAAVTGMLLASCTPDEKEPVVQDEQQVTFNVEHASDFIYYSGTSLLGSTMGSKATRAANVNGNQWYQNWGRPTNVTEEERAKVVEEFSKKREGEKNTISVTWKNFWVQQVYKGETTYTDGFGQNIGLGSDHMNHLLVFNNLKTEVISWWPYEESVTEYEGQYEHINNFNSGNNTTTYTDDETHQTYQGTTLMVNMGTDGRDEQFAYHNSTDSKYHYEYIILNIDGAYYIGFDFYANGTQEYPANKNMDVERDWIFNDWIVKVTPAQKLGAEPVDPDLHEQTDGPADPADLVPQGGEIEVNLSLNALRDKDDYIYTKLSIHVRDTSDVEVFIPVTPEYYCEADDMNIVLSHRQGVEMHSSAPDRIEYNIGGQTVTATVEYEAGGIRIKTQGITSAILKYLRQTYADGLTVEVWNYYNAYAVSRGRDELKQMLDRSTISFTTAPGRYVNAFARLGEAKNPLDCTVTPPEGWTGTAADGTWNYNVTYRKE